MKLTLKKYWTSSPRFWYFDQYVLTVPIHWMLQSRPQIAWAGSRKNLDLKQTISNIMVHAEIYRTYETISFIMVHAEIYRPYQTISIIMVHAEIYRPYQTISIIMVHAEIYKPYQTISIIMVHVHASLIAIICFSFKYHCITGDKKCN